MAWLLYLKGDQSRLHNFLIDLAKCSGYTLFTYIWKLNLGFLSLKKGNIASFFYHQRVIDKAACIQRCGKKNMYFQ
jgi:hypothetical protein